MSNKRITRSRKWSVVWHVLAALVIALALLPAAGGGVQEAAAQENDAANDGKEWSHLFAANGVNGVINALAVDASGNLYAGGSFTMAGHVAASNIAKWDGSTWSALGNGISSNSDGGYSVVYALAVDAAGNLYVGGHFTRAGNVTVNNVAKWNGSRWSALGGGFSTDKDARVNALAIDAAGNLYAADDRDVYLDYSADITVYTIAKWDGNVWSSIGSGLHAHTSGVSALATDANGNLYASGGTVTAGNRASNVATWDGSRWRPLNGSTNSLVSALAVDANSNLYVGGRFTGAGSVAANHVAVWRSGSWVALGSGIDSEVYALALDAGGNLYAGGVFSRAGNAVARNIARWNGNAWSALGGGVSRGENAQVRALAVDSAGNLYVGGQFTHAWLDGEHSVAAYNIAKWDGSTWSVLGSGGQGVNKDIYALAMDAEGNVYAGGRFSKAGDVDAYNVAKWDGRAWSALGGGIPVDDDYSGVYALTVDAGGTLYAAGRFTRAGGVDANNIAKWDGRAWSPVGRGITGDYARVSALATDSRGNLYAGGVFDRAGRVAANNVAKWDGNTWSALDSGVYGAVYALAVDAAGNLYAGGEFSGADTVDANNIAMWNGSAWSPLGSGTSWRGIYALAVDANGALYAGGEFYEAGGAAANNIAKWNGSAWSPLGAGIHGDKFDELWVSALALDGEGNLYAGGWFTWVGGTAGTWGIGVRANNIAMWNGSVWLPLASGLDGAASALVYDGSSGIYAGGNFTAAGGRPSYHLAHWGLVHPVTVSTTGSGTVVSDPSGIACGLRCTETFDHGLAVTLTARPNSGSVFMGWGGDCSGTGVCTLTMDGPKQVTANFRADHPIPLYLPRVSTKR